jgi:hypothetical protein
MKLLKVVEVVVLLIIIPIVLGLKVLMVEHLQEVLVLVVALWLRFWPRAVITVLQKMQDTRARKLRRKSLLREQDLAERLGYR